MADGALPQQTRRTRTSAAAKKIELGMSEEVGCGKGQISKDAFDSLSKPEQLVRINARLKAKGMQESEFPKLRELRRYWQRRDKALAGA
jgi:hypothetical protein